MTTPNARRPEGRQVSDRIVAETTQGLSLIRTLACHGVGRALHAYPEAIATWPNHDGRRIHWRPVLAVVSVLSRGGQIDTPGRDGWTLRAKPRAAAGGQAGASVGASWKILRAVPLRPTLSPVGQGGAGRKARFSRPPGSGAAGEVTGRLVDSPPFGGVGAEAHCGGDGRGDGGLVDRPVHRAFADAGAEDHGPGLVGAARIEVVLERHLGPRVRIAAAVRSDHEDRVVAGDRVGFRRADQALENDGAGLMAGVAPVDVIGVLAFDHQEPGFQRGQRADRKLGQKPVTARVLQAGVAEVLPPARPERLNLGRGGRPRAARVAGAAAPAVPAAPGGAGRRAGSLPPVAARCD